MQAIDSLQGKMTMLIIAHRLSDPHKNSNIVIQGGERKRNCSGRAVEKK